MRAFSSHFARSGLNFSFLYHHRVNKDTQAHRIDCIDNAMPAPPFCWSDQVGSVNSLGSDFGVGAGANGGIGTVGVWNYRCAAHPLHTGKFSVAINQAQIATVPLPIGASCALPASLQIFLGDKLSITNNAQVAYMFRIDNSLGNLIIQFYINIGETRVVDSALTAGLGGGQTFKYYCDAQIGTGTLNVGFSRSNAPGSTPPPTPVPPTPPPTPSPAPGAPTNAPTPSPTLPPTPSPTPVPQGGILTPPPTPVGQVQTPAPGVGPTAPQGMSCLEFCSKTCSVTKVDSCDCSTNPPSVTCMRAPSTKTATAATPRLALAAIAAATATAIVLSQ